MGNRESNPYSHSDDSEGDAQVYNINEQQLQECDEVKKEINQALRTRHSNTNDISTNGQSRTKSFDTQLPPDLQGNAQPSYESDLMVNLYDSDEELMNTEVHTVCVAPSVEDEIKLYLRKKSYLDRAYQEANDSLELWRKFGFDNQRVNPTSKKNNPISSMVVGNCKNKVDFSSDDVEVECRRLLERPRRVRAYKEAQLSLSFWNEQYGLFYFNDELVPDKNEEIDGLIPEKTLRVSQNLQCGNNNKTSDEPWVKVPPSFGVSPMLYADQGVCFLGDTTLGSIGIVDGKNKTTITPEKVHCNVSYLNEKGSLPSTAINQVKRPAETLNKNQEHYGPRDGNGLTIIGNTQPLDYGDSNSLPHDEAKSVTRALVSEHGSLPFDNAKVGNISQAEIVNNQPAGAVLGPKVSPQSEVHYSQPLDKAKVQDRCETFDDEIIGTLGYNISLQDEVHKSAQTSETSLETEICKKSPMLECTGISVESIIDKRNVASMNYITAHKGTVFDSLSLQLKDSKVKHQANEHGEASSLNGVSIHHINQHNDKIIVCNESVPRFQDRAKNEFCCENQESESSNDDKEDTNFGQANGDDSSLYSTPSKVLKSHRRVKSYNGADLPLNRVKRRMLIEKTRSESYLLSETERATEESISRVGKSQLYFYIDMKLWEDATDRCTKFSEEANILYSEIMTVKDGKSTGNVTVVSHLPLHRACELSAPLSLVKHLITIYPKALETTDHKGRLPIHLLMWKKFGGDENQLNAVSEIIKMCTKSVSVRDKSGSLPLHIAILHAAPLDTVQALVKANPDTLFSRDYRFDCTALDLAKNQFHWNKKSIVEFLEDQQREQETKKNIVRTQFDPVPPPCLDDIILSISGFTDLMRLIKELEWDNAIRRCQSHSRECSTWFCEQDRLGNDKVHLLPLHRALEVGAPPELLETLIHLYPLALKEKDHNARLPLHTACWRKASIETVSKMLSSYKEAVNAKDIYGRLPLHIAVMFGTSSEIVRLLVKVNPSSVFVEDRFKQTALQIARTHSSEAVTMLLESIELNSPFISLNNEMEVKSLQLEHSKSEIWIPSEFRGNKVIRGRTELYKLIEEKKFEEALNRCSSTSSEIFIRYSESKDSGKKVTASLLPIHLASLLQPPLALIMTLIHKYPDSVLEVDHSVRTPLHCSLWQRACKNVVELLVRANPSALKAKDKLGRLPLHVAVEFGCDIFVIEMLAATYAEAVVEKDNLNRDPFFIAHSSYDSNKLDVLKVLSRVNLNRKIRKAKSKKSMFSTINSKNWNEVVEMCTTSPEEAREWVQKMDDVKNKCLWRLLPMHRACELQPNLSTIEALYGCFPEALNLKDHHGRLPIHSLCKREPTSDVIQFLLRNNPGSIRIEDSKGRLPIHIACEYGARDISVISHLLLAFPESVNAEDRKKNTPFKIVQKSTFPHKETVLNLLQSHLDKYKQTNEIDLSQNMT